MPRKHITRAISHLNYWYPHVLGHFDVINTLGHRHVSTKQLQQIDTNLKDVDIQLADEERSANARERKNIRAAHQLLDRYRKRLSEELATRTPLI